METFVYLHIDSSVLEKVVPRDALQCIVKKEQNNFPIPVEEKDGKYWTSIETLQNWFLKKFSWLKGITFNRNDEIVEIPIEDCDDKPDLLGSMNAPSYGHYGRGN